MANVRMVHFLPKLVSFSIMKTMDGKIIEQNGGSGSVAQFKPSHFRNDEDSRFFANLFLRINRYGCTLGTKRTEAFHGKILAAED